MNSLSAKTETENDDGDPNPSLSLPAIAKKCIVAGIEKAYRQDQDMRARLFNPPPSITEYLMTGSIAKELWTSESPTPERGIVVQVECSATDFVNNAFERFRFDPFRRRKHHRTKRRGRIDIAVLQFGKLLSFKSVVGIELKGFNPPEKNIRSDLARLIHAMEETDPVGENSIVASFLAFIMSLKKKKEMLNARDVEPRIRNLQNKVERSLDGILTDGNGLQKNIYIWRIDVDGSDEVAQRMPEDVRDQNDIASETRAVVGVLVTITRKVT